MPHEFYFYVAVVVVVVVVVVVLLLLLLLLPPVQHGNVDTWRWPTRATRPRGGPGGGGKRPRGTTTGYSSGSQLPPT